MNDLTDPPTLLKESIDYKEVNEKPNDLASSRIKQDSKHKYSVLETRKSVEQMGCSVIQHYANILPSTVKFLEQNAISYEKFKTDQLNDKKPEIIGKNHDQKIKRKRKMKKLSDFFGGPSRPPRMGSK